MDREEKQKLEQIDKHLEDIDKEIHLLAEKLEKLDRLVDKKPSRLGLDDLIQELAGAAVVALPVSLSDEIWELATRLSLLHVLLIYGFVLLVAYLFVAYGNTKDWQKQTVFKFLPLRLLTSSFLSFGVSALLILLLGIYPNFIDTFEGYIKTVLLVSSFSIIGSLGLDMAK
ncbi:MAG: DUF2391 family protein [Aquificota bacterium]